MSDVKVRLKADLSKGSISINGVQEGKTDEQYFGTAQAVGNLANLEMKRTILETEKSL